MTSLLLAAALLACVSRRGGLSRDALEGSYARPPAEKLPTVPELLLLRVPPPAQRPSSLVGSPAAIAFAAGADVGADASADAFACLRADARRDYAAIVARCLSFAETHPADARAPAAVRIVTRHLGSLPEAARQALFDRTAPLVTACAASHGSLSCADLALVVDDARRQAAGTEAALAGLKETSPWALRGAAEGPFDNADDSFAGSLDDAAPLRKHPRYRVFDVADRSDSGAGTLVPSYRDTDGWWRVTVRGTSDDTDAILALKAGGPLEVRVDKVPVLVRPRGTLVAELERVPLHLNKGFHTIEILSLETGGGVRVAVVDHRGARALTPVVKQKWGKNAGATRDENDHGAVAALVLPATIDGADADVLSTLLFRHVMARGGVGQTVDDERVLARVLLSQFGWSAPALVAAAQTIEDDALPDRTSAALAAPLWLRVQETWPDHPVALLAQARLAAVARPDDALNAWRAVVAARPDYAIGHRELVNALLEHDVIDEALASANVLLSLGETRENIDASVPALRAAGQMTRALALVEKGNRNSRDERWRQALRAGDTAAVRQSLVARAEDGDDGVTEAALDLVEIDDVKTALRLVDATLLRHPWDRRLLLRRERLAALDGSVGSVARAVDPFSAALTVDLNGLLWREARGEAVPWSNHFARGDAVIAARRATTVEPWPGFASVFLQDDLERRFAEDGTSLVIRHWIAELRSKEALDGFGELHTGDAERLLRLRVVKKDGRILEPERHSNVDDLSLPELAAGDIVEWLSVEADNALVDGSFWETRSLRQSTPAVTRRYVLALPKKLAERVGARIVNENGAPAAVVSHEVVAMAGVSVDVDVYSFELAAPPLLDEPMSVDREEVEPMVGLIANIDDRFFQRLRRGDLAWRTRADPWLRAAAALIAGRGSDEEKLQRIFRFVAEEITAEGSPADAVSVLASGSGQRLPLFVALARAAGLTTSVLALHTPSSVSLAFPNRGSWQGLVVRVATGDPGTDHAAWFADKISLLDRLPPVFAGSLTLNLETGARGKLNDDVIEKTPVTLEVDLALAPKGNLQGHVALRLPAYVGDAIRDGLRAATDAQLSQFLEGALTSSFPGVKATRVTVPGLDDAAGPLAVVAEVDIPAGASGTVRFEHLFASGAGAAFRAGSPLQAILRVADRKRPLRSLPEAERLLLAVHLPPTASFVEVPEAADVIAGPVRLTQTSTVEDGTLVWERSIRRSAARVEVADWPQVRAALAPLLSRADARIAFVAALPTSTPEKAADAKEADVAQTR